MIGAPELSKMADARLTSDRIVLLFGPSGAGKTTLSKCAAKQFSFRHIEIDRYPDGDGIDLEGLRTEWECFLRNDSRPFVEAIKSRIIAGGFRGAVLSFPSLMVPTNKQLEAAKKAGICSIVLYGTKAECMKA